jgi:hypothetical protein
VVMVVFFPHVCSHQHLPCFLTLMKTVSNSQPPPPLPRRQRARVGIMCIGKCRRRVCTRVV